MLNKITALKKIICLLTIIVLISSISKLNPTYSSSKITLTLLGNWAGGSTYEMLQGYVSDINIDLKIRVEDWYTFVNTLLNTHDFDLVLLGLYGGDCSPDMRSSYTESGELNLFGLNPTIPYNNLSETLQNLGIITMDLEDRRQIYFDWQELMMDKIIPLLPLYSYKYYMATWDNTKNFDPRWSFSDNLPYIYFDDFHTGQISIDEFNIADANWNELNPLFMDDSSSSFIWELISEPIVQLHPDLFPLKTGLVYDWEMINDNHFKFYMRDNVFWCPSYNITGRNATSSSLDTIPS